MHKLKAENEALKRQLARIRELLLSSTKGPRDSDWPAYHVIHIIKLCQWRDENNNLIERTKEQTIDALLDSLKD